MNSKECDGEPNHILNFGKVNFAESLVLKINLPCPSLLYYYIRYHARARARGGGVYKCQVPQFKNS